MTDLLTSLRPTTGELHRAFASAAKCWWQYVQLVTDDTLLVPTPCEGWTVRDLINHVVTGELMTLALCGEGPMPTRGNDYLGDDWRAAAEAIHNQALILPDRLEEEKTYSLPMGELPGWVFVRMRTMEYFSHAWDIADALGKPTSDWDMAVLENVFAFAKVRLADVPRGEGKPFHEAVPIDDDAPLPDRFAAFLGRTSIR